MLSAARWLGVGAALLALSAKAQQDFGLDLTGEGEGKPTLRVTLATDLKGATLYVDDVEIGTLPMGPIPLSKGEHTVTVTRPGYADFTSKVKADKGPVDVSAALVATGEALHLTSDPDGADIVVDGKGAGKTPKWISLAPGRHDLRVVKDRFNDWTYTLFTRAGRDTELNAELKSLSDKPVATSLEPEQVDPDLALRGRARSGSSVQGPWYTRWYTITGAAVVLAAAVTVVAVVASQPHPPNPSAVCGGPCDGVWNPP
jgi:hypothetical protein